MLFTQINTKHMLHARPRLDYCGTALKVWAEVWKFDVCVWVCVCGFIYYFLWKKISVKKKRHCAFGDTWLGCVRVWNCACNGLISKVGFRFEGFVCQGKIIITHLPPHTQTFTTATNMFLPKIQGVFFSFLMKQDNNRKEKGDKKRL